MQNLSEIPGLGQFFVEEKLKKMIKEKKWIECLNESSQAINSVLHGMSYKIWYYKAIAECATFQFRNCESTAAFASFLANGDEDAEI